MGTPMTIRRAMAWGLSVGLGVEGVFWTTVAVWGEQTIKDSNSSFALFIQMIIYIPSMVAWPHVDAYRLPAELLFAVTNIVCWGFVAFLVILGVSRARRALTTHRAVNVDIVR
jgi:hypothetical protein